SALGDELAPGCDKFKVLYPEIDWHLQLAYAEKIGLGSCSYELEKV
ncbi:MAG TPA: 4Fe-4S ferredoxin, partial [Desulfarculaceae bacterium]|nr:4Fe-4S ferredoxin [Desulfarculaceae bacterium]